MSEGEDRKLMRSFASSSEKEEAKRNSDWFHSFGSASTVLFASAVASITLPAASCGLSTLRTTS